MGVEPPHPPLTWLWRFPYSSRPEGFLLSPTMTQTRSCFSTSCRGIPGRDRHLGELGTKRRIRLPNNTPSGRLHMSDSGSQRCRCRDSCLVVHRSPTFQSSKVRVGRVPLLQRLAPAVQQGPGGGLHRRWRRAAEPALWPLEDLPTATPSIMAKPNQPIRLSVSAPRRSSPRRMFFFPVAH